LSCGVETRPDAYSVTTQSGDSYVYRLIEGNCVPADARFAHRTCIDRHIEDTVASILQCLDGNNAEEECVRAAAATLMFTDVPSCRVRAELPVKNRENCRQLQERVGSLMLTASRREIG
jgi:hypothetical protein